MNDFRTNFSAICAALSLLFISTAQALCPQDWVRFKHSCYDFAVMETNWYRAQSDCIRHGASLVIIETHEENEFLRTYLRDNARYFYGYDMWLGGKEDGGSRAWRWLDGTLLNQDVFSDWQSGKPDDTLNVCLEFESEFSYHWNDDFCDELNYHICERPLNPPTPPFIPADITRGMTSTTPADVTSNPTDVEGSTAEQTSPYSSDVTKASSEAGQVSTDNPATVPFTPSAGHVQSTAEKQEPVIG